MTILARLYFCLAIVLLPLSFTPSHKLNSGVSEGVTTPPSFLLESLTSKRLNTQQERFSGTQVLRTSTASYLFPIVFLISSVFLFSFLIDSKLLLKQGRLQLEGG